MQSKPQKIFSDQLSSRIHEARSSATNARLLKQIHALHLRQVRWIVFSNSSFLAEIYKRNTAALIPALHAIACLLAAEVKRNNTFLWAGESGINREALKAGSHLRNPQTLLPMVLDPFTTPICTWNPGWAFITACQYSSLRQWQRANANRHITLDR